MLKKPEILAPAGDFEKLKYAVAYGADAVYLAGRSFGMRAAAANFGMEELREGIVYAHARGAKCYITVNIIPSNADLAQLPEYLGFLQAAGADALIVADVGVLAMAKRYAPRVPVHISTQTSILNHAAANFWAEQGAARIVLARELRLDEIAEIRAKTPPALEMEAFVHGAMCISYSGRCLISQYLTGRDANHGACAQPCRWKYQLVEEKRPGEYFPVVEGDKGTYLYNSKDLCMIDHIPELLAAGIDSFKIEGRNKSAYYAAGVTGAYRKAVDLYWDSDKSIPFTVPPNLRAEVEKVSHRNYYTGFYLGSEENGQHYEDSQYIRDWEVTGLLDEADEKGHAVFRLKNRFYPGETLELLQPNREPYVFPAEVVLDDEGTVLEVVHHPEMRFHLDFPFPVEPFSILRKQRSTKSTGNKGDMALGAQRCLDSAACGGSGSANEKT